MKMRLGRPQGVALFIGSVVFVEFVAASADQFAFFGDHAMEPIICKDIYSFDKEVEYNVVDVLGKGGYGRVFLGYYNNNNTVETVALKRLNPTHVNEGTLPTIYERLSIYKQLDHPNIAKFKECYEDHGTIWIMMEYVDGKDLCNFEDSFVRATVSYIMFLLMDAVNYLHSQGIMHRDIKDGNVMITKDGQVKLIDFDLVFKVFDDKWPTNYAGSYQYAAPEVLKHFVDSDYEDHYDLMADIWSCGILFYKLIVGVLPKVLTSDLFGDETLVSWAQRVDGFFNRNTGNDGPMWVIEGYPEWNLLLGKMLLWDPSARSSSEELRDEFQSSLNGKDEIARRKLVKVYSSSF